MCQVFLIKIRKELEMFTLLSIVDSIFMFMLLTILLSSEYVNAIEPDPSMRAVTDRVAKKLLLTEMLRGRHIRK